MFWTDPNFQEPLRQHRWYIEFDAIGSFRWALKEVSKPSFEINTTEHTLLTHKYKFPGILTWKPIDLKLVSARSIGESVGLSQVINNFMITNGYKNPSVDHQSLNKTNKEIKIIQISDSGNQIETWKLHNCLITSTDYGKLSYENEDFVEISMTIAYDYAVQN